MEKVAPNSKFVGHSTEIILQRRKKRGPLLISKLYNSNYKTNTADISNTETKQLINEQFSRPPLSEEPPKRRQNTRCEIVDFFPFFPCPLLATTTTFVKFATTGCLKFK